MIHKVPDNLKSKEDIPFVFVTSRLYVVWRINTDNKALVCCDRTTYKSAVEYAKTLSTNTTWFITERTLQHITLKTGGK